MLQGCTQTFTPNRKKRNHKNPWNYDKQLCKQHHQVERLFRHLKKFRRIFTRYNKLDIIFLGFVYFALIVDALMWTRYRYIRKISFKSMGKRSSQPAE